MTEGGLFAITINESRSALSNKHPVRAIVKADGQIPKLTKTTSDFKKKALNV
jgi:hypothetical protein